METKILCTVFGYATLGFANLCFDWKFTQVFSFRVVCSYTAAILLEHPLEKYWQLRCCTPAGLEPMTEGNSKSVPKKPGCTSGIAAVLSHAFIQAERAKRARLGIWEDSSCLSLIDSEMAGPMGLKLSGMVEGVCENVLAKEFFLIRWS